MQKKQDWNFEDKAISKVRKEREEKGSDLLITGMAPM